MTGSQWWKDFDAGVAAVLPPGSRVLDVGCGDGGLVNRLGELGFYALGVDPAAPAHLRLIREPVEHVRAWARRPHFARMLARHDLEAEEQALIDVQMLPALGFWMIAGHARAT
jgi:2-polyprenyl-3-methyl-5-hydroxy-6-metoxy-1,4-benzoquinol methylase